MICPYYLFCQKFFTMRIFDWKCLVNSLTFPGVLIQAGRDAATYIAFFNFHGDFFPLQKVDLQNPDPERFQFPGFFMEGVTRPLAEEWGGWR